MEIKVAEGELAERMGQMRTWLDGQRYKPSRFKLFDTHGQFRTYRVSFEDQREAVAFAKEFEGRPLWE